MKAIVHAKHGSLDGQKHRRVPKLVFLAAITASRAVKEKANLVVGLLSRLSTREV